MFSKYIGMVFFLEFKFLSTKSLLIIPLVLVIVFSEVVMLMPPKFI